MFCQIWKNDNDAVTETSNTGNSLEKGNEIS